MALGMPEKLRGVAWQVGFLACYLTLEWATFRHDVSPLGLTPWNASAGLALALLLRQGTRAAPLLALALLLADITVRQVAFPWWVELAEIVVTVASYAGTVHFIQKYWGRLDAALTRARDVFLLLFCVIAGTMLVAVGYIAVLVAAGLLARTELAEATLRLWGGDLVGILAVTPFVLLVSEFRLPRPSAEVALQIASVFLAVGIVFSGGDGFRDELAYLLFLPIGWIALRNGIVGASVGLFAMQISLMIALHLQPSMAAVNVVGLQALLLILLLSGLAIGVLTSERQLLSERLHRHQATVSQVGRVAGMSSFSNSLAHEISQPLTAIGNFTRAAQRALDAPAPDQKLARDAIREAATQLDRAVEITRKLRSLFEMGRVDLAPHDARALVEEAIALIGMETGNAGVSIEFSPTGAEPRVLADRFQIVLVLVNLLRNAAEAGRPGAQDPRRIGIEIEDLKTGVLFRVRDNGIGFPAGFDLSTHEVGLSEKPQGLGIGLGICRSIIDAHQGRLYLEFVERGASVAFTLSRAGGDRT